jgi:demethylmenaquinone methyltransferase/2-methoxy-6-polyprenyl-1,4-benzoquinol methylase
LVLDFGKPDRRVWRALYLAYLRWVVPVFGRVFCGDAAAYGYILESLRHYPSPAGLAEVLRQSGWGGIRVQHLFGGVMGLNEARRIPT